MFEGFIEATREEVKIMKEKISAPAGGKSQRLSNLVNFNLFITVQETGNPPGFLYCPFSTLNLLLDLILYITVKTRDRSLAISIEKIFGKII
jgi:hypothetical protein